MSTVNGTGKEDRHGIDRLRTAIEDVAADLEARQENAPARGPRWGLRVTVGVAVGAAAVLIALLIGSWWIVPPRSSEVEVLVLKIHGRDVSVRIVDDTAPATIIVIPQPEAARPPAAASIPIGGAR
jgi:hypothetical protein